MFGPLCFLHLMNIAPYLIILLRSIVFIFAFVGGVYFYIVSSICEKRFDEELDYELRQKKQASEFIAKEEKPRRFTDSSVKRENQTPDLLLEFGIVII